jgi:two-component sensor histidine kinase
VLLVASDVTEQRAAEQARFEAAISQREMLVKEVHHRIKNNLQGVAGLLQQTPAQARGGGRDVRGRRARCRPSRRSTACRSA